MDENKTVVGDEENGDEGRHHVFESIEAKEVSKLQARNQSNEKLCDFSAAARMAEIRAELLKRHGPGHYVLVAYRHSGRVHPGYHDFDVYEPPRPPPQSGENGPAQGVDLVELLRKADGGNESLIAVLEAQARTLEEARESERAILADAREEAEAIVERAERRAAEIIQGAREDAADLRSSWDSRHAELREHERELALKEKSLTASIEQQRLDLSERIAKSEREKMEYFAKLEREAMKREFAVQISKIKADGDGPPQKALNLLYTRLIDRRFPEPSQFERFIDQALPIFEEVADRFLARTGEVEKMAQQVRVTQAAAEERIAPQAPLRELSLEEAVEAIHAEHERQAGAPQDITAEDE